jgi:hypothetical protein
MLKQSAERHWTWVQFPGPEITWPLSTPPERALEQASTHTVSPAGSPCPHSATVGRWLRGVWRGHPICMCRLMASDWDCKSISNCCSGNPHITHSFHSTAVTTRTTCILPVQCIYVSCDSHNSPLKTEFLLNNISKSNSYLTGNTLRLHYKAQPVNARAHTVTYWRGDNERYINPL